MKNIKPVGKEKDGETSAVATESEEAGKPDDGDTVSVFRTVSGEVETISTADYLCGVIAAEISPEYDEEAIKAQAVACHTYELYMKNIQEKNPDESLMGADLSDSPDSHQGYISASEQKKKWGDKYEEYSEKIRKCVEAVQDKAIKYDGEYIVAAFHAINTGRTEDCKNLWGDDLPYLTSVVSSGDTLSPDFKRTKTFTQEEMKKALEEKKIEVSGEAEEWFGKSERSEAGNVLTITVCKNEIKGSEIREALGLVSNAFTISFKDGTFTAETEGYGHMIGLSQCGADYMARQGFTFDEILRHYYTGAEIEEIR